MNFLILNVHSALNLGDEAIMAVTVSSLRQAWPESHITVAANDPASWQLPDVTVVPALCSWVANCRLGQWRQGQLKMPFYLILLVIAVCIYRLTGREWKPGNPQKQTLLQAYYQADMVLSCGGGNFYAHHSASPALFWNLVTVALAVALGKPVVMLPQSFGPIRGRVQLTLARLVFNRVRLILCREPISQQFLEQTLHLQTPILLLPDLAFGLDHDSESSRNNVGPPQKIGVTVLDRGKQNTQFQQQEQYEDALVTTLLHLHKTYGAEVHLFVQCYGPSPDQDDRRITQRLYEQIHQTCNAVFLHDKFHDAYTLKKAYAEMDFVIATRMHTGIFALSNGTPAILISYQPKALGMVAMFGLDRYCLPIEVVTPIKLLERTDEIVQQAQAMRQHITERWPLIHEQTQLWLQEIQNIKAVKI